MIYKILSLLGIKKKAVVSTAKPTQTSIKQEMLSKLRVMQTQLENPLVTSYFEDNPNELKKLNLMIDRIESSVISRKF